MPFYVYIMASQYNGTLYIGHTDDLARRAYQHRTHETRGFTDQYNITRLVWFEACDSRHAAFIRERQLKAWKRAWKVELIEATNRHWDDLFPTLGPTIR